MIEQQLKDALIALQDAIASSDATAIRASLATIDEMVEGGRKEFDARLKHFLRNRSYLKALAYLNGETDIPTGRCSGRTDFT